jgi:hypothetical protein
MENQFSKKVFLDNFFPTDFDDFNYFINFQTSFDDFLFIFSSNLCNFEKNICANVFIFKFMAYFLA